MNKYGLTVIVTRGDMPGVEMKVEMPEVGREHIAKNNPALEAMFINFDNMAGAGTPEEEEER